MSADQGALFYEANGVKADEAIHTPILEAGKPSQRFLEDYQRRVAALGALQLVAKANPNHGPDGRFSSVDSPAIVENSALKLRTEFKVGGKKFIFEADAIREGGIPTGEWGIAFGRAGMRGGFSTTLSNDPDVSPHEVMAKVVESAMHLLQKKKPKSLSFTATLGEPKKVAMFERMGRKMAARLGFEYSSKNSWSVREVTLTRKSEEGGLVYVMEIPADALQLVAKANPYHDELGRFAKADFQKDSMSSLEALMQSKYHVTFADRIGQRGYGASWGRMTNATKEQHQRNAMDAIAFTMDDAKKRGFDFTKLDMQVLRRDPSSLRLGSFAVGDVGARALALGRNLFSKDKVERQQADALARYGRGDKPGLGADAMLPHGTELTAHDARNYAATVIRHEIGHNLTSKSHIKSLMRAGSDVILGNAHTQYSESDAHEFLSEAFAHYAGPGYRKGTYSKPISDILDDMSKPVRLKRV